METKRELKLPRLIGGRSSVRQLAAELGPVQGDVVVLNGRDLRSASPSSADEFVRALLLEGGATRLEVTGSGSDFIEDLEASARAHGLSARLKTPSFK